MTEKDKIILTQKIFQKKTLFDMTIRAVNNAHSWDQIESEMNITKAQQMWNDIMKDFLSGKGLSQDLRIY